MNKFPHAAQILQSVYQAAGGGTGEIDVVVGTNVECFVAEDVPNGHAIAFGQIPAGVMYLIATTDNDPFEGPWTQWISNDPDGRTAVVVGREHAARLVREALRAAAYEDPEWSNR